MQLLQSHLQDSKEGPVSPARQKSALQSSSTPLTDRPVQKQDLRSGDAASIKSFLGNRLSQADFAAIDLCVKEFIVNNVVHFMSNNIREWERDVIFL